MILLEHKAAFFLGVLVTAYPFVKRLYKKLKNVLSKENKNMNSEIYQNNIVVWKEKNCPSLTSFGYQTCMDFIDNKLNISLQQCKKPEKIEKIQHFHEMEKKLDITWRTIICNKNVDFKQINILKEVLLDGNYFLTAPRKSRRACPRDE